MCAVWIGFDDNKQLGLTGAEAALPAWIEFMKEAVAMRPSLGGSSFGKPGGIVSVKIDPETGQLAGPNCPMSQTVNVASPFVPRLECFKHMPVQEFESDDLSSEMSFETDTSSPDADSGSVGSNEPEEFSNKVLSAPNDSQPDLDDEMQTAVSPKVSRQSTQPEIAPTGRVGLINVPVIANDAQTPKPLRNPRQ